MKKIILLTAAGLLCCACSVKDHPVLPDDGLIRFYAEGLNTTVSTKTAAITSLDSFNVIATTGTAGSETQVWGPVQFSGNPYSADKYWPASDPKYHFYAANTDLSFSAQGCGITVADASIDIVAAYLPDPSYKNSNNLTFHHIFTRIGTIQVNAPSDYTITDVSLALSAPVSGSYNLRTGAWSPGTSVSQSLNVGSNDVYVVPGTYTLTVNYTLSKGDYTDSFSKSGSVTLEKGKINKISTTVPEGSATEIRFSVTIDPWTEIELTPELQ